MNPLHKSLFYTLIAYPLLGFITISFFNVEPYYVITILIFILFTSMLLKKNELRIPKYIRLQFVYLIFVTISIYVANQKPLKINTDLAQLLFILNAILILIIIENMSFTDRFIATIKKLMLILIFSAAVVSIVQYFIPDFFLYDEKYTGTLDAEFGYKRRIASIFSWGDLMNTQYMAIGFMAVYGISLDANKTDLKKTISLILSSGIVAFLSGFRVIMLTYLITTFFLVIRRVSLKTAVILSITVILFNFLIGFLNFNLDVFFEERIKSESAMTRIYAFKAFFHAFPENPYFGTGGERTQALFDSFGRKARMHNWHLNIAYYYGIFAFLAHSIFLFYIVKRTYRTAKYANYWPPFVGMICYLVATMTDPRGEFFIPGLLLMMVFNKYYFNQYLEKIKMFIN